MLVLTRRPGEVILINPNTAQQIKIMFMKKYGHQTKVGIEAPKDAFIIREEIYNPDFLSEKKLSLYDARGEELDMTKGYR